MAKKGQLTTADYLPIEEFDRFCDRLHQDKKYIWEMYARLSFCTALRASDVLSLTWKEILGREELVKTEQKTGKTRTVKFNESVIDRLQTLYQLLGSPDINVLIFISSRTGKHYSIEYINRELKVFRWKYKLPIKAFSTHTFRKTFGRYVYETMGRSAESLILLNSIFRHSTIQITKAYIGLTIEEINQVFEHIKF